MRYRYLDDFRRAVFSYGIAVLGTPQCSPHVPLDAVFSQISLNNVIG